MNQTHDNPDRDLDQWIDLLAGEPRPDADPALSREARALRRAAVSRHLDETQAQWQDPLAERRFLKRLKKRPDNRLSSWILPAVGIALAATITGVMVLSPAMHEVTSPGAIPEIRELMVPKGAFIKKQPIFAETPLQTGPQLCTELKALGLSTQCAPEEDAYLIYVENPETENAGLDAWLQHHQLQRLNEEILGFIVLPKGP